MTIPVWVKEENGEYTAIALGDARLLAVGATREAAISDVRNLVSQCIQCGTLVQLDLYQPLHPPREVTREEREHLDEMVAEIYRLRDEEKAVWIAELDRTPEDWLNQRHPCA